MSRILGDILTFRHENLRVFGQLISSAVDEEKHSVSSCPPARMIPTLLQHEMDSSSYPASTFYDGFVVEKDFDFSDVWSMRENGDFVLACQSLACPAALDLYSFPTLPP